MADPTQLPLWPDTVAAFYADRACSIRSDTTRKSWGYTYRRLQHLHPATSVGEFRTDDLVAFVTQRNWDGRRWASSTARNYRVALQLLFAWPTTPTGSPSTPPGDSASSSASAASASGNPIGSPKPRSPLGDTYVPDAVDGMDSILIRIRRLGVRVPPSALTVVAGSRPFPGSISAGAGL